MSRDDHPADQGQHPAPFALEAWHAGEVDPSVAQHLEDCAVCRDYVEGLSHCRAAFSTERDAEAVVRALRDRLDQPSRQGQRRWLRWIALPAATAVALLLLLWPQPTTPPIDEGHGIRLKGDLSLAVIRRASDGRQSRHRGELVVAPGDRLRVELAVPRAMELTVALLDDQARRWTVLQPPRRFTAGLHRLDRPLEVDAQPTAAWLIAGPPGAVARARARGRPGEDVARLRLRSAPEPAR